jgi:Domain of unknown function (DUF5134)
MKFPWGDVDVTRPSWLAGTLAAVMIVTAAYSAGRLVVSRLRGRSTEFDADALHVAMGAAMAGMLVPGLAVLPDGAWAAVFGIAAAWFGWHAVSAHRRGVAARGRFPLPHLVECAAMLYMLSPMDVPRSSHPGPAAVMAGMGGAAGATGGFPVLAIMLALFMVCYIVWTADRLTALARHTTPGADTGALSPKLAACGKIAMSATMGYMLILML